MVTVKNSTRTQQSASLETCEASHNAFSRPTSSSSFQILIANPRLKSALSRKDPNELQISNREPMAFSCSSVSREPVISNLRNLIVTPRLESPATPTKQNSNPISNRYKSPFFAPLSRSSPITRHSSRPCPEKAQGRRRVTVAPTSRKAIMCRNHFTQIPRSKPLLRKVTNADTNQS